jgi:hypothetical protein
MVAQVMHIEFTSLQTVVMEVTNMRGESYVPIHVAMLQARRWTKIQLQEFLIPMRIALTVILAC